MGQIIPFETIGQMKQRQKESFGESNFPVYPPGDYTVLPVDVKLTTTSKQGIPQLQLSCEIIDGPNGNTESRGKKVTMWVLCKEGTSFLLNLCKACGVEKTDDQHLDTDDFVNRAFRVAVTIETWEGKDQNRFGRYRPALVNGGAPVQARV